jgi:hypothetical protein
LVAVEAATVVKEGRWWLRKRSGGSSGDRCGVGREERTSFTLSWRAETHGLHEILVVISHTQTNPISLSLMTTYDIRNHEADFRLTRFP